jgi:hypothetical protein
LIAAPEPPCSLVDFLLFVRIVVEIVDVVVIVVLVVFFLVIIVIVIVVVDVVPVGEREAAVVAKDELAAAFRAAQRVAIFKVVGVNLFEIAVRASRHIARSSIESATSRRTLDYSEIREARATNPNGLASRYR